LRWTARVIVLDAILPGEQANENTLPWSCSSPCLEL
jgi:hypothetical protein